MPDREKVIKALECCTHDIDIPLSNADLNDLLFNVHKMDFCKKCPYYNPEYSYCFSQGTLMKDALALLKEQGWNLLTEDNYGIIHGLPGDDGQYLMTDGRNIWIDDYMDGADDGIFLDSGRDIREIKAWMYMPKLPQEGGEVG